VWAWEGGGLGTSVVGVGFGVEGVILVWVLGVFIW